MVRLKKAEMAKPKLTSVKPEWDVYSFDEQFSSGEEEALETYSIVKRQLIESKDFTWSHGEG
ncbi:unnamed protein product [Arabidopsis lyrata]|nr:unnamed protein product [Arabidopsis lyrata]